MSLTILNGYIIHLIDFQVFDQIVTILFEDGTKTSLISLGSKKINSKNARNLTIGNFNENEFFSARNKDKIGRLKKTVTIKAIDWKAHDYLSFNVLNDYIYFSNDQGVQNFLLYKKILEFILDKNYSDLTILIVLLVHIIRINGLQINSLKCFNCNKTKNLLISLYYSSWICGACKNDLSDSQIIDDEIILKAIQDLLAQKVIINSFTKHQTIIIVRILYLIISNEMGLKFNCLKI